MRPSNILVPTDFSPGAELAIDYACALAEKLDATVHLMNATGAFRELGIGMTTEIEAALIRNHHQQLDKIAEARGPRVSIGSTVVKTGDARDAILEAALECDADLIVMGTHGRRGIARWMLGSVAEDVMRRAPCPVLVVRTKPRRAP
jgi:nucleotide-binding universal stress UspA family protein